MLVAGAAHERAQLGERRDARPGNGELIGKPRSVGAAGTDLPDVVLFHLRQGHCDEGNFSGDVVAIGSACEVGAEPPLVRDDDYSIAGDSHIELERVDPHGQCVGEGGERILRAQRTAAAMGFDVERCGEAAQ